MRDLIVFFLKVEVVLHGFIIFAVIVGTLMAKVMNYFGFIR
jgi:hypothetical protein